MEDPATIDQDQTFRMREADLERHLSNSQEVVDVKVGVTVKSAAPATPSKSPTKREESDATKPKMLEFGSKDDYQLHQALNLLKGMNILQGK